MKVEAVDEIPRSVDRRRELNRLAAQKLRNRQKEKAVSVKQDYFAAQSRNTQLQYDVKQLRKMHMELYRQVEEHISVCRRVQMQTCLTQTGSSSPISQTMSFPNAAMPQYAVYSADQQAYVSPVYIVPSDGSNGISSAVQLVPVSSSELNLINTIANSNHAENHVESEQNVASVECSDAVDSNSDGMSTGGSDHGISDISPAAVDDPESMIDTTAVPAEVCAEASQSTDVTSEVKCESAAVNKNTELTEACSVPSSPVSKPVRGSRRRCSLSALQTATKPATRVSRRAATDTSQRASDEQPPAKKRATADDNLPLCVSSLADDE